MNEMEAKESIDLIKDMIGKTKKAAAYSGDIYIVWGVLTLLAVLGTYLLVILKLYQYIWINWTAFMGAGFIYSIYHGITSERRADLVTFTGRVLGYTWFACGVALVILSFVAPMSGLYPTHMIPALVAIVIGIGYFITGKVVQWKFLVWLSFLWWAGGTGMMFIKKTESILLIFALLMSLGYLVPGFILRANYKKVKKGQDEE